MFQATLSLIFFALVKTYTEHMTLLRDDAEGMKEMARQTAGMVGAELAFRYVNYFCPVQHL